MPALAQSTSQARARLPRKRGVKPLVPFFIPVMPSLSNGNVDPDCDFLDGAYSTLRAAVAAAADIANSIEDDNGAKVYTEFVIYRLVPVMKVTTAGTEKIDG